MYCLSDQQGNMDGVYIGREKTHHQIIYVLFVFVHHHHCGLQLFDGLNHGMIFISLSMSSFKHLILPNFIKTNYNLMGRIENFYINKEKKLIIFIGSDQTPINKGKRENSQPFKLT